MGDNLFLGLDLNQEPLVDPPSPSRVGIEDRLRQLEGATAMAGRRQRWRRSVNNPAIVEEPVNGGGEITTNRKRDVTQLAKALGFNLGSKRSDHNGAADDGDDDNGGFFDCNICLDMATDPILTCCGHLFCWACFYQVPYVDSIAKECPVCKGEIIDSNITPIYGNGKSSPVSDLDSGVKIPPRPPARRVESLRQQRFRRGISNIPVADSLRRISIGLGLIDQNPPQGVISGTDSSLSSISSALNSAERFVEDLEAYINGRRLRRVAHVLPDFQEGNIPAANSTSDIPTVLETDSSVEIDLSISRRRRRVVTRALN